MPGLEALSFATPLALGALALLPLIWWLLRFTPPRPKRLRFPPFRLLLDLVSREDEADRMPWWLMLLRLAIATLAILAVSYPLFSSEPSSVSGAQPRLIIIDDGWAAAADWDRRREVLLGLIDAAQRSDAPVTIATTTPASEPRSLAFDSARRVRIRAAALQPHALETSRLALLKQLRRSFANEADMRIVWLSDGLDAGSAKAFAEGLVEIAGAAARVSVLQAPAASLPVALVSPELGEGKLKLNARRADTAGSRDVTLDLTARNGRSLASARLQFAAGSSEAEGEIALPLELRNEAAMLRIAGMRSAASVWLLDDRWRRKTVAIHSGASLELEQPLLDPLYYVSRALEPYAELSKAATPAEISRLLETGPSMLVLADVGKLPQAQRDAIGKWVTNGGVLVRFAGPRLAGSHDELVPVRLRAGGRSLGSALSWEEPQPLSGFTANSPFAGLKPDASVRVSRQVLADPSPDLSRRVWATLADGTPLITAARRENGLIVLFHITANADWSNLPLTGQFVDILRRVLDLAPGAGVSGLANKARTIDTAAAFVPLRSLNGFGALTAPPPMAAPVAAGDIAKTRPSPSHPAGLYGRNGGTRAINTIDKNTALEPISGLPAGVAIADFKPAPAWPLAGILFAAALFLFLLDCLAALVLSGRLRGLRLIRASLAVGLLIILAGLASDPLHAEDKPATAAERFAMANVLETRLAYVLTGHKQVDDATLAGLSGLSAVLADRTSIEPGAPSAVDIEADDIVFFPLIYWPVLPDTKPPSAKALAKIDQFMKHGGTIFFDTRDRGTGISAFTGEASPATRALRQILEGLDIPALEPVPAQHVLTKAFYLLQSFPGRYGGGPLWVEARQQTGQRSSGNSDGVTSIIIGSNDYAGAWAVDNSGRHLFAAVPGGETQREFAIRTGINIVMYALTGNYKADQVHIPALLERLGQ